MRSTAAFDLSGFVDSAVRYLLTFKSAEATGPSAAVARREPPAAGADVRSLCLQWMELMLVERPHLLLQDEKQQQNLETKLRDQFMRLHGKHQPVCIAKEEQPENALLQYQRPLISAVLYTALTAAEAAASADATASKTSGAAAQSISDETRQSTAQRGLGTVAPEGATGHLLKMALSILKRFTQLGSANLRAVAEELLLLLKMNRRFLVSIRTSSRVHQLPSGSTIGRVRRIRPQGAHPDDLCITGCVSGWGGIFCVEANLHNGGSMRILRTPCEAA